MSKLTERAIQSVKAGKTKSERMDNGGSLEFFVTNGGIKNWNYRYSHESKQQRIKLGIYPAMTLGEARKEAEPHSRIYGSGTTDLKGYYEAEQKRAHRQEQDAIQAKELADEKAKRGSLENLMSTYIANMEANGKSSVSSVRGSLQLHVTTPYPALVKRYAADLGPADFRAVLARLIDQGKGRKAAQVRAYLRAAYQLALTSEHDPSAPAELGIFGLSSNPLDAIPALNQFNLARDRTLTFPELCAYTRMVREIQSPAIRGALLLSLYLGGQRPQQLVRSRLVDIDLDGKTITLFDPKGRRRKPRVHLLPLQDESLNIVEQLLEHHPGGDYLLTTGGKVPVCLDTLSSTVAKISKMMSESELAKEPFQLRDIRRTCETHLAKLGISKDIRAQLQSHGLGGVQDRHYDKHDYLHQKQMTLATWSDYLAGSLTTETTPLR